MDTLFAEVRVALRALLRRPVMSATVVVTLSVGIALVGTVFGVINAAFYRPISFAGSERIVALTASAPHDWPGWSQMPREAVDAIRGARQSFERIAVFSESRHSIRFDDGFIEPASVTAIDSSVTPLITPAMTVGRSIAHEDIVANNAVAVISDSLWRARFDSTRSLAGRVLHIDGRVYSVIGVLAPRVRFYERSHVLIPLVEVLEAAPLDQATQYSVLGKLRPEWNVRRAQLEVSGIQQRLSATDSRYRGWAIRVQESMFDRRKGLPPQQFLWALFAAAASVLLVACTNVSNLLLVRAVERAPEMAVRASLGASRLSLAKNALLENAILSLAAAMLGLVMTILLIGGIARWFTTIGFRPWTPWSPDWTSALFALAVSGAALVMIGLAPLRVATRADLMSSLRQSAGTVVGRGAIARRGRRGVVVMTVLSLALSANAVLMWRSYAVTARIDLGYDAANVLAFSVRLDDSRYAPDRATTFYRELANRLEGDARIANVAFVAEAPSVVEGPGGKRVQVASRAVSDAYFAVTGINLVAGRAPSDESASGSVAIVSASVARALWPGVDPSGVVGRSIRLGARGTQITVGGVAADVSGLTRGRAGMGVITRQVVYIGSQQFQTAPTLLVRAARDHGAATSAVRSAVAAFDPDVAVEAPRTMVDGELGETLFVARVIGAMITGLSVCALALALLGIYAVVAYSVSQRTAEIGLRLALGATPAALRRFLALENARAIGLAMVIGVGLCAGAARATRVFLVGAHPLEPVVLGGVAVFLLVTSLLASYLPTAKATSIAPMDALRGE